MKKLIPYPIRMFRTKIKWFFKNYNNIKYETALYNNELHGPATYKTDGLITSNNCDFITESRFSKAYDLAKETNPWENFTLQWRVYINCWFADYVKKLEGDFVECGVNTGAYAIAIINYIDFNRTKKKYYLFDTFNGLVEDLVTEKEKQDGISNYLGSYKDVYQQVVKTFAPYNVEIIKGAVPDTLSQCDVKKVCYLSIDMNCVKPEIEAAEFFWDKIVSGGVIVLDDYGFPAHINQKLAFDEFAKNKNVEILCLPTAQGIIFKP